MFGSPLLAEKKPIDASVLASGRGEYVSVRAAVPSRSREAGQNIVQNKDVTQIDGGSAIDRGIHQSVRIRVPAHQYTERHGDGQGGGGS